MKTTVKHLSDTKVELTISVTPEALKHAESVAVTQLSKTAKIPGFRKGHAPASVAVKHLDPTRLAEQTLDAALSRAVADAFMGENIQVLNRPEVDIKKYVPAQTLEFVATAEILPEVKLGDYKKLKAKKEKIAVAETEVETIIDRMRRSFSEKKEFKRAAKDGDEVTIDFVGKDKDGVAFEGGAATDYQLVLGSDSFIPGFESGIVGKKAGEAFTLALTFPADYHAENLKSQKTSFDVTLKKVSEIVLPEVNDEFAAKCGPFTSVDELRADIKRELTDQKEREAAEKLKDALVEQLIDISTIPLPQVLVDDQMVSIERDMTQNLMYQGTSLEQYLEGKKLTHDAWRDGEVKTAAEKRVKAGLALAELTKLEKIEASDDEIAAHVQQYRERYKNTGDASQFDNPEVQRDIANRLMTEKTVDRLVELNSKQ